MNTEQKKEYSATIEAMEVNDRIVYKSKEKGFDNFIKGTITDISTTESGLKKIDMTPDKKYKMDPQTYTLNDGTAKDIDGLFGLKKEDEKTVKYNREYSYMEFKTLLDKDAFGGLGWNELKTEMSKLLSGDRTKVLEGAKFKYTDQESGRENNITRNARFELTTNQYGQPRVANYKVEPSLNLDKEFYGRKFTTEEKKQLLETDTLGLVEGFVNTQSGEVYNMWVGLDRELNKPLARPQFAIKADKVFGIALNKEEQKDWLKGKPVTLERPGKEPRVYIANGASTRKSGIINMNLKQAQSIGIVDDPNKKEAKKGNAKAKGQGLSK